MKNLTMIAAIGKNYELGRDGDLVWRFKNDMKFFKDNTWGKFIVMGRKTFYSLPSMLPGRRHVVLSHDDITIPGVIVVHSKEELLHLFRGYERELMVIGGASIYEMFLDEASKMLLTEVDDSCKNADVYFPRFDKDDWNSHVIDENVEKGISFRHVAYTRKLVRK